MKLEYNSKITDIVSSNSSFDGCKIRICYHGKNRNKTKISKSALNRAASTLKNCPVVCHYDIMDDTIGGHDVSVVDTKNGVKLFHLTDPVGVVPGDAEVSWETVEDDGEEHEYMVTDAILWKRSPAYEKIKQDGITSLSMEIDVKKGEKDDDGYYKVDRFEFTALCLLGENIAPCFESASVQTFSTTDYDSGFQERMSAMMSDFKQEFSAIAEQTPEKKGVDTLGVDELLKKYNLSADDVDFELNGMSIEDMEARFAQIKANKEGAKESSATPNADPEPHKEQQYSLTAMQTTDEFRRIFAGKTYRNQYDVEYPSYYYIDYDAEAGEVYAYDNQADYLTGMAYTVQDNIISIDFESAKRKIIKYVDFSDGDENIIHNFMETVREECQKEYSAEKTQMETELNNLRNFKAEADRQKRTEEEDAVFGKFSELSGLAEFEEVKKNCSEMSIPQIEEKCFAILGRQHIQEQTQKKIEFSQNNGGIRIPIEKRDAMVNEPYGGVFMEYGSVKE